MATKLFMKFRDTNGVLRGYVCSGSLIDPKHVVTAGHCVYAHDDSTNGWVFNDWAEEIIVVPAYENGVQPYGSGSAVELYSWTGWTNDQNWDDDIGMIHLDRPVGALIGWHGYGWSDDCDFFTDRNFRHVGYPAASPYDGQYMYRDLGNYDGCETILGIWYGNEVSYDRLSYGGQSGSGSYEPPGGCPACWVRAVLSNGNSDTTWDVRITEGKFNLVGSWIGGDTPTSADLSPIDVNVGPGSLVAGSTLSSMDYLVHNYSSAPWSGTVTVEVYLSTNTTISTFDTLIQTHSFGWSFSPKSSVRVNVPPPTIPATATPGTRYIGVIIDTVDAATANNSSSGQDAAALSVIGAPDLEISSFGLSDTTLTSLQWFWINATARNAGLGPSGSSTLRYYLSTNSFISSSDTELGTDFVAALGASGTSIQSLLTTGPGPGGSYWIGACVDSVAFELSWANNCSSGIEITVDGTIFADGFESGDLSAWSGAVP